MATYLLMHGGGMGGWTWKYMRALLEAEGHTVFTPTFTGFGERVHLIGRDVAMLRMSPTSLTSCIMKI
jgi:hypothetical protein